MLHWADACTQVIRQKVTLEFSAAPFSSPVAPAAPAAPTATPAEAARSATVDVWINEAPAAGAGALRVPRIGASALSLLEAGHGDAPPDALLAPLLDALQYIWCPLTVGPGQHEAARFYAELARAHGLAVVVQGVLPGLDVRDECRALAEVVAQTGLSPTHVLLVPEVHVSNSATADYNLPHDAAGFPRCTARPSPANALRPLDAVRCVHSRPTAPEP